MKTIITEILPRQDDDGSVMNVTVKFLVPEKSHRNNSAEVSIFIDKGIDSLDEINRLALDGAIDVLKKIIARHP